MRQARTIWIGLPLAAAVVAALGVGTATGGAARAGACTGFGPSWAHGYNAQAKKQGNPVRIVSACCGPRLKSGAHSCYVTVTLAGTKDRGCETVLISAKTGLPAGPGKHENCLLHTSG
jgi:hypothetical protein